MDGPWHGCPAARRQGRDARLGVARRSEGRLWLLERMPAVVRCVNAGARPGELVTLGVFVGLSSVACESRDASVSWLAAVESAFYALFHDRSSAVRWSFGRVWSRLAASSSGELAGVALGRDSANSDSEGVSGRVGSLRSLTRILRRLAGDWRVLSCFRFDGGRVAVGLSCPCCRLSVRVRWVKGLDVALIVGRAVR